MHILLLMVTIPVPIHSLCVPGFLLCPVMEVTGPPQCNCSGNYTKEEDTLDCTPPAYVNKHLDRFIQNEFNCDNKRQLSVPLNLCYVKLKNNDRAINEIS